MTTNSPVAARAAPFFRRRLASVLRVQEHDLVSEGLERLDQLVGAVVARTISCGAIVCATAEASASPIVSAAW
ncbi:MAG: hypothetical protein ABR569_15410 [Gaiellaceae bacterium]